MTARGSTARTRCRRRRAAGSRAADSDYAVRFHLHPSVKASRLSDARGVMLVLPNRDVWTFEALDDKVDLEDSVFLAGNDGPRRTAQIVIRQDARQASSIRWSFVRSTTSRRSDDGRGELQGGSRNYRSKSVRAGELSSTSVLRRFHDRAETMLPGWLTSQDPAP